MRKALMILAELDDADLAWFAEIGKCQMLSPGNILIEEGKPIKALFVVLDGQLQVVAGEKKTVLAHLASGNFIGEMSLIEKQAPTVSVISENNSKVLEIPQQAIQGRLEHNTDFAARFYRALAVVLSDRLRSTSRIGARTENGTGEQARSGGENELEDELSDRLLAAGDRMRHLLEILDDQAIQTR
jgi:CRP/FNR family cyclic AMP-dependent transcriptional regulator